MVMKQTRHIFDLGDINAVRIQCNGDDCHSEWIIPLGKIAIPSECPSCELRWTLRNGHSTNTERFLRALGEVLKFPDQQIAIRFEIDGEEKPS